jgi:hypothetical protein
VGEVVSKVDVKAFSQQSLLDFLVVWTRDVIVNLEGSGASGIPRTVINISAD